MRVAVLGAGGFVGSHLVPALLERFGCEVDAVDVSFDKLELSDVRVRKIVGRVEHEALVDDVTSRCQVVVSLTALCNPALYNKRPLEVIDANYTHLLPLVRRCAERRVRLIHCSTSEVYGRIAIDAAGQRTHAMDEETTALCLGPVQRERWTYACAKQLLERVIWAHGEHGTLPFTIVRLFNVIGPRMDYIPGVDGEGVPRVLASFMHALLAGSELPIVDGGQQRRTFMAVSDLLAALLRIVERPERCHNQILNLGNPRNDVSILELAQKLSSVYRRLTPDANAAQLRDVSAAEFYGAGYDDSEARVPDVDKARRLLDWEPAWSLDDMLPGIVSDYIARYRERVTCALRTPESRLG